MNGTEVFNRVNESPVLITVLDAFKTKLNMSLLMKPSGFRILVSFAD